MVSLFDEALEHYITAKSLSKPKQYRNDLNGRIDFLHSQGALHNSGKLHGIRKKRNDLAHEAGKTVSWQELDDTLGIVEQELQKLGFVGDRPQYEYYGERSKMRTSINPQAFAAVDYYFGVTCEGRKVIEFSSTLEYLNSSD